MYTEFSIVLSVSILARPDDTSSRSLAFFASWVTGDIWLVPFNSRTPEVSSTMRELAERSLIGTYLYS